MKNESISTLCTFKQHTRLHGQALYGLYELLEFCLLHTLYFTYGEERFVQTKERIPCYID
jgi:hypothetical protein